MKPKRIVGYGLLGAITLFPALAPAPRQAEAPKVGELKSLADARAKVCEKMLDYYRESLNAPPAPGDVARSDSDRYAAGYEPLQLWSSRLLDARLDGSANLDGRIKVLTDEVARIKKFEGDIQAMAQGDRGWRLVANRVEFYRLEAEYRLAKEKSSR